ncbi:MAG: hypothetical protein EPO08_20595 [Rhodospirillaceae bacterium]|nr:MAG: hypothetical protein EPO08_20595 [Rhodospirillaceae bacterium]
MFPYIATVLTFVQALSDGAATAALVALGLATEAYVNSAVQGFDPKGDAFVTSMTNINVAAPGTTIDGQTPSSGKIIGLVGQTAGAENGLYVYNGSAVPMTRAPNADTSAKVTTGMSWFTGNGTQAGVQYYLATTGTIVLGTTSLNFQPFTALVLFTGTPSANSGSGSPGSSGQAAKGDHSHPVTGLVITTGANPLTGQISTAGRKLSKNTLTADGAISATKDVNLFDTTSASVVGTMPAATGDGTEIIVYWSANSGANTATVAGNGSDTVADYTGAQVASLILPTVNSSRRYASVTAGQWIALP